MVNNVNGLFIHIVSLVTSSRPSTLTLSKASEGPSQLCSPPPPVLPPRPFCSRPAGCALLCSEPWHLVCPLGTVFFPPSSPFILPFKSSSVHRASTYMYPVLKAFLIPQDWVKCFQVTLRFYSTLCLAPSMPLLCGPGIACWSSVFTRGHFILVAGTGPGTQQASKWWREGTTQRTWRVRR